MQFKLYFFLGLCTILYDQNNFVNARALIGQNVRQVSEREFPYVVPLVLTNLEDPLQVNRFCGAALISNRDVLTAEHCLENTEIHRVRILVGSDDIRLCRRYYILWTITYYEWVKYRNLNIEFRMNDIAIIRLSSPVPNNIAMPVPLTTLSNSQLFGLNVSIAGWGKTNANEVPMIMETVSVKVFPNDECERRAKIVEGKFLGFHYRLLCTAAEPYAFLTFGDSGNPVIYNDTIVGVSSGTCFLPNVEFHPEKLNLHFGIEYYKTFILDVMHNFLS